MRSLREIQDEIGVWSESRGWHNPHIAQLFNRHSVAGEITDLTEVEANAVASKLALVHSEVSEALEALRDRKVYEYFENGKPGGVTTEIADVIIRCLDLLIQLNVDAEAAIAMKMEYNRTRPFKHGGKII